MITFVCGPSGSGKTTTIERAGLAELGVEIIRASHVLRDLGRPVTNLTGSESLENQAVLFEWLATQMRGSGKFVLDGHLLILTDDGPQLVPEALIRQVPFDGFLMIYDEPQKLLGRAQDKSIDISLTEMNRLLSEEEQYARQMAERSGAKFEKIASLDTAHLRRALGDVFG